MATQSCLEDHIRICKRNSLDQINKSCILAKAHFILLFIISLLRVQQNNMAAIRYRDNHNPEQLKAVNRLLEVAEKKMLIEDNWHETQGSGGERSMIMGSKNDGKRNFRVSNKAQSVQRLLEKERLKQLVRVDSGNDEESVQLYSREGASSEHRDEASMTFLKNAKLRPFNSNMTFYNLNREQKERIFNSSLTFYQSSLKMENKSQKEIGTERYSPVMNEIRDKNRYKESKSNNSIIYFRPNKSETIRQLLNHMREEKQKNHQVVLNSTHHSCQPPPDEPAEPISFSDFQVRELNKYRKFLPFKEDQNLLIKKISQNENVWMKKFKEGWQRRKNRMSNRRSYFKQKLIVTD